MDISTQNSGLDFKLEPNKIVYKAEQYPVAVDWEKTFEQGNYVYRNPASGPSILYGGVRHMENLGTEKIFNEYGFMADATFINPGLVGDEYIKTVGHYHGDVAGRVIEYPEVYEPLTAGIEYLLQSEPDEDDNYEAIWVLSQPGDKVMMMPNYGHVSINVSDKPVLEVDVQKRDNPNDSIYYMYKERIGGAVYRTAKGLVQNPHYKIKSLRVVRPLENPTWGLVKNVPLYTSLVQNPEKFIYLNRPQDFTFDVNDFYEDITPPFQVFEV